jgi:hypothetical protein
MPSAYLRTCVSTTKLSGGTIEFRAPSSVLSDLTWKDLALGLVFLALPQLPLTLGNAIKPAFLRL